MLEKFHIVTIGYALSNLRQVLLHIDNNVGSYQNHNHRSTLRYTNYKFVRSFKSHVIDCRHCDPNKDESHKIKIK